MFIYLKIDTFKKANFFPLLSPILLFCCSIVSKRNVIWITLNILNRYFNFCFVIKTERLEGSKKMSKVHIWHCIREDEVHIWLKFGLDQVLRDSSSGTDLVHYQQMKCTLRGAKSVIDHVLFNYICWLPIALPAVLSLFFI